MENYEPAAQKRNNGAVNKRLALDLALTILLLCALAYRVTGDAAHEWIGAAVCVVCIAHNALNRNWWAHIFNGAYTLRRGMATAVNLLLALAFAALIITGVLQSRAVLAFLHLPGGMELRLTHTTAAYWCLPLIGVHIGLHWGMIMNAFRKMLRIKRKTRTRKTIARITAFAAAACGVWSSFDRDMFSKLFLGFSFDYWPEERPAILFFALNLSIMGVYIFITYYVLNLVERKHERE
ncbi:MAG: DUF4405 domain-containing protein [Treponema sp.]|jgi:hypothetical protein|nr:DUF4405 domain-containing protein [Treponema sp.]